MSVLAVLTVSLLILEGVIGFQHTPHSFLPPSAIRRTSGIKAFSDEQDEENPYQDQNYPELEFIDYSDPDYVVDQGVTDEYFPSPEVEDDTEVEIEKMREERRRRNDEFQFETYFEKVLKKGDEYCGEWAIYKTSTFLDGVPDLDEGTPQLIRARQPLKAKSRGYKIKVETDSEFRVDGERICHEETIFAEEGVEKDKEAEKVEAEIIGNKYCPDQLKAFDFRGWQGIMCVGNCHTISSAVPLLSATPEYEGPYSEMFTEVGISDGDLRMRVKLAYSVRREEKESFLEEPSSLSPALHLKSMTVCREARERFPNNGMGGSMVSESDLTESESLFGIPGAQGGLYDPPPVGSEKQASQYMMLDLEGGATVLFPYLMNQDPESFNGYGWVTSLDWTPGRMRYQVDRKVKGGVDMLALRTLELSEVQSQDAETYRPRDGGQDMRQ